MPPETPLTTPRPKVKDRRINYRCGPARARTQLMLEMAHGLCR
jgi:hypothetical protein